MAIVSDKGNGHTPGVEHDGVEEMTASLRHDGQNTSEIGTAKSAVLEREASRVRTFCRHMAQWEKP